MAKEDLQLGMFEDSEIPEIWEKEWGGMPEFVQEDLQPFQSVIVHFDNREDMDSFSKLIGQKLTYKTVSIWFPKAEIDIVKNLRYSDES